MAAALRKAKIDANEQAKLEEDTLLSEQLQAENTTDAVAENTTDEDTADAVAEDTTAEDTADAVAEDTVAEETTDAVAEDTDAEDTTGKELTTATGGGGTSYDPAVFGTKTAVYHKAFRGNVTGVAIA